jgi:hypothetical protein
VICDGNKEKFHFQKGNALNQCITIFNSLNIITIQRIINCKTAYKVFMQKFVHIVSLPLVLHSCLLSL